jgi:hypothetical protein
VSSQRRGLFLAAQAGNASEVRALLEQFGPEADLGFVQAPEGNTPLHVACICGHAEVVRLLLEHGGAPLDARDAEGRSPLYVASMGGHLECVQLLLNPPAASVAADGAASKGAAADASVVPAPAPVNQRSHAGLNAVFVAAWRGHKEVVALLRLHGGDIVGPRDFDGRHCWQLAREWNHAELADELEQAARAQGWTPEKDSPLPAPAATTNGSSDIASASTAGTIGATDPAAAKDVVLDLSAVVEAAAAAASSSPSASSSSSPDGIPPSVTDANAPVVPLSTAQHQPQQQQQQLRHEQELQLQRQLPHAHQPPPAVAALS